MIQFVTFSSIAHLKSFRMLMNTNEMGDVTFNIFYLIVDLNFLQQY
jgi:hypothetical protein